MAKYMTLYGAEIVRVEDTIGRICAAYSKRTAQIYATPANFIITIKGDVPVTDTVMIGGRQTNLDRLGRLNDLSRWICYRKPEHIAILKKLNEINKRPVYPKPVLYAAFFTVGGAFTFFYGGTIAEAVFGALLAVIIKFVSDRLKTVRASAFLNAVVCSAVISFIAVGVTSVGFVPRFDKIIIGASMTLVPGIQITNCMRDFISGDFYSGIYTLTEALLTAAGLAVGAGSAVAASIRI